MAVVELIAESAARTEFPTSGLSTVDIPKFGRNGGRGCKRGFCCEKRRLGCGSVFSKKERMKASAVL